MPDQTQLIYEIAGKRYILIQLPFADAYYKKNMQLVEKYKMVYIGVKQLSRSFLGKSIVINSFLLPEENFNQWASDFLIN